MKNFVETSNERLDWKSEDAIVWRKMMNANEK